ncbi:MAG: hypothetical protein IIC84_04665 [Chloroflexi bacterium]|nr:hypothetical protein [Chloroflexota bacterium]
MDNWKRNIVRGLLFLTLTLLSLGVACSSAAVDATPRPSTDTSPPAAAQLVESESTQTATTQPTATSPPAPTAQAFPTAEPERRATGRLVFPIDMELTFADTPDLGREVQLVLKVTPHLDIPDAVVTFELPEGIEAVAGDIRWAAPLFATGETREFTLTVKAISAGDWKISAHVGNVRRSIGRRAFIYVSVTESGTTVSDTPAPQPIVTCCGLLGKDVDLPAKVELTLSAPIDLGREAQLIFTVTPLIDVAEAKVLFRLPREFKTLDEKREVRLIGGAVAANETRVYTLTVKVVDTGEDAELTASFRDTQNTEFYAAELTEIYVNVTEKKGRIIIDEIDILNQNLAVPVTPDGSNWPTLSL